MIKSTIKSSKIKHLLNNNTRIKKLIKEGWWVIFGQLVQLILGIVFIRLISDYLESNEFGRYSLDVTVTIFVDVLIIGGLKAAIVRFYFMAQEKKEKNLLFFAVYKLLLLIFLFVAIVCAGVLVLLGFTNKIELYAEIIIIGMIVMASAVFGLVNAVHAGARRQKIVAISNSGLYFFRVVTVYVLSPALFLYMEKHVAIMVCVFLSTAAMCLYSINLMNKLENILYKNTHSSNWLSEIIKFALPYSSWGGVSWAQQIGDRWILNYNLGMSSVGIYTALYQTIYAPILAAGMSILGFVVPVIYQEIEEATDKVKINSTYKKLKIACIFGVVLVLIISGVAFVFRNEIAQTFLSKKYNNYANLVPSFVVAAGLMACYHLIGSIIPAIFKTKEIVGIIIFLGVGSLLAQFFGSRYYGVDGIIFAWVLISILYLITMWCAVAYLTKSRISDVSNIA